MELEYEFPGVLRCYKSGHVERFDGTTVTPAAIDPITGVKSKDLVIDECTGLSVRLYLPNIAYAGTKLPILFFIHGGAFMIHTAGSPVYHNLVNCLVSNAKAIAVSVTYRLTPEYPVPVAYEDAWDALKWVVSSCKSGAEPWLGKHGDLDHIVLAGDSAGANIAHNLAVKSDREPLKDLPRINGLLLMNPYFWGKDPIESEALEPGFRSWLDHTWDFACAGKYDLDHPFLNPMLAKREEWMKPRCDRVMVTVSEHDMFRERGKAYVEKLRSNGWKGKVEMYETYGERHVYFLAKPKSEKAIREIEAMAAFIKKEAGLEENCSEELRIIEASAQGNFAEYHWENVMRAWWQCHQQRMNFIFSTSRENRLKLPSKLCSLKLGYCCISDGALSECLRGMEALEELCLKGLMTITTLPPKEVMQSMQSLRVLKIKHCWCLKSLGGLHALAKLEKLTVQFCWCLEMEYECPDLLPPTLQFFVMTNCAVPRGIFMGNLQCLKSVEIGKCDVPINLSFSHLIPLKSLMLYNCPNLLSIEGFDAHSSLDLLFLVGLSNLDVQSVLKSWKGSQVLQISSLVMLNELLSSTEFAPPQTLDIYWQDDIVSFEKSDSLRSIQNLSFVHCDTREMPTTLRDFSTLESIEFYNCPNLSKLPELPPSVNYFQAINCPALRESCQPSGSNWDKIHRIQHRTIE